MTSGTILQKIINHALVQRGLSPSYKNQPAEVREKAVEIANALLQDGAEEGIAIATGLKQARELLKNHKGKTHKNENHGNE
jgi:uncharacterized protein YdaT